MVTYSRSQKVGNPIASILKSNVEGIPALFGLHPVSNFMGFTVNPVAHPGAGQRLMASVDGFGASGFRGGILRCFCL